MSQPMRMMIYSPIAAPYIEMIELSRTSVMFFSLPIALECQPEHEIARRPTQTTTESWVTNSYALWLGLNHRTCPLLWGHEPQ